MKISIIIPVYNGQCYILNCITSLLRQTYDNWEAIFVNDGSKDGTLNILNEYKRKDNRIIVISQVNAGVVHARNVGVKNATGEYILFLDVDDTLEYTALEKLKTESEIYPESDIIVFGINIISDTKINKSKSVNFKKLDSISYLKRILCGKNGWELWGKMYHKRLFSVPIDLPEHIRVGEDAAVFVQLVARSKVVIGYNFALYNYIQYSTSVSHIKSITLAEETLKAAYLIDTYLKKQNCYKSIAAEIDCMFLLFYSNSTRRAILDKKHPLIKDIKQNHWKIKAFKYLPPLKAVYILLNYYGIVRFPYK